MCACSAFVTIKHRTLEPNYQVVLVLARTVPARRAAVRRPAGMRHRGQEALLPRAAATILLSEADRWSGASSGSGGGGSVTARPRHGADP